jgi:hypothetical protein
VPSSLNFLFATTGILFEYNMLIPSRVVSQWFGSMSSGRGTSLWNNERNEYNIKNTAARCIFPTNHIIILQLVERKKMKELKGEGETHIFGIKCKTMYKNQQQNKASTIIISTGKRKKTTKREKSSLHM